jgi:hypothetical protein
VPVKLSLSSFFSCPAVYLHPIGLIGSIYVSKTFPFLSHRAVSTETKVNVSVSVTVESRVCNVTPTSHNKLQLLGSVVVNNVGYYSLSLQDLHVSMTVNCS